MIAIKQIVHGESIVWKRQSPKYIKISKARPGAMAKSCLVRSITDEGALTLLFTNNKHKGG